MARGAPLQPDAARRVRGRGAPPRRHRDLTFSVEQRIQELGIRRALGGRAGALLGMVLGEGARLAGLGIVLGVAGALVLTRFLQGMLYGVQQTDPATVVVLRAAMLAVARWPLSSVLPMIFNPTVDK